MPFEISPQLLDAMAFTESSNNPQAVNENSGARGMYQFLPIGWQDVTQNYPDLAKYNYDKYSFDPQVSRLFAQKLLELNAKRLKDNASLDNILASYNFGIGNVRAGKEFPKETKEYIAKIKRLMNNQVKGK